MLMRPDADPDFDPYAGLDPMGSMMVAGVAMLMAAFVLGVVTGALAMWLTQP